MRAFIFSIFYAGVICNSILPVPLYKRADLPIAARVDDLISRMTVEELIAQTFDKEAGFNLADLKRDYGNISLGAITVEYFHESNNTLETLRARNAFQEYFVTNSRLNIPVSIHHEGLHSGGYGGTIFPEPLLSACSWNDTLQRAIGAALGYEARGAGVDNVWSPVINMWQDDRFGRYQEGFSPDPTITSHMGRSVVMGIQGGVSSQQDYLPGGFSDSSWSSAKHYLGYGSAVGGLNGAPFVLNNRTLFEHFLRPWRSAVAVGLRGAMPSHNAVLDTPMHANRWMIHDVLRGELGAGNLSTVSDCNDIGSMRYFNIAPNMSRVSGYAIRAGVDRDLQCGGIRNPQIFSYLTQIENALAD